MSDIEIVLALIIVGILYILFNVVLVYMENRQRYYAMLDEYQRDWKDYFES
jgi:amino acid transporter